MRIISRLQLLALLMILAIVPMIGCRGRGPAESDPSEPAKPLEISDQPAVIKGPTNTTELTHQGTDRNPAEADPPEPAKPLEVSDQPAVIRVRTNGPGLPHQGSGFLFKREGDDGYFLTSARVVSRFHVPEKQVTVIFNPASKQELIFNDASVIAADEEIDLAVLKVTSAELPPPLTLEKPAPLPKDSDGVSLGFRFMEGLTYDQPGLPALSCPIHFTGLIKNPVGKVVAVRMEGFIDPGFSGGPVFDRSGRLLGMAVTRVRDSRNGLVLPVGLIQETLQGKIESIELGCLPMRPVWLGLEVKIKPFSPFNQAQSLKAMAIAMQDFGSDLGTPMTAEQKRQAAEKMYQEKITDYNQFKKYYEGKFCYKLPAPPPTTGKVVFMAELKTSDGQSHYTDPRTIEVPCAEYDPDHFSYHAVVGRVFNFQDDSVALPWPSAVNEFRTIKLPAKISDLDVGGHGRYLVLYFKEQKQLAVFDWETEQITHLIDLPGDEILFAAGEDKIVVQTKDSEVFIRYDLESGRREKSIPLHFPGLVSNLCMGSGVRKNALFEITGEKQILGCLTDIFTLEEKCRPFSQPFVREEDYDFRAAANGSEYALWMKFMEGTGYFMVVPGADEWKIFRSRRGTKPVPNANGQLILTRKGIWNRKQSRIMKSLDENYIFVPDPGSDFFMGLSNNIEYHRSGNVVSLDLFLPDDERPMASIPLESTVFTHDAFMKNEGLTMDKRFHLSVADNKIIYVPESDDQLQVLSLDLNRAFIESGIDYLYFTSILPPPVIKGKPYSYQVQVASRWGGLEYRLASAPEGMEINEDGLITWMAPQNWSGPATEYVIVSITDRTGQSISKVFEIQIG